MKLVAELEMEWGYIGRSVPTTKSMVRVEYMPYALTEQYKLKNPHASVLSVEGWNPIAVIPMGYNRMSGNDRSNYNRFRRLFREGTGYRGKGLLQAVQADFEAQMNGRAER